MFGYVKINKQELLVKDYETYKAVYCGLCKTLGKRYTVFSRMVLNFDYTFYAVILAAVSDKTPEYVNESCLFNPLCKKRCCKSSAVLNKAADALIITTYHKLCDSIADSGIFKSLFYRLLRLMFTTMYKKACKHEPKIASIMEEYMVSQNAVETDVSAGIDKASQPTADLMTRLFADSTQSEETRRILSVIGQNVGRWIYIIDAADDLVKDVQNGRFNPIANELGINKSNVTNMCRQAAEHAERLLNMCISESIKAVDLLIINRNEMIIKNIIYMGMPSEQSKVINRLIAYRKTEDADNSGAHGMKGR